MVNLLNKNDLFGVDVSIGFQNEKIEKFSKTLMKTKIAFQNKSGDHETLLHQAVQELMLIAKTQKWENHEKQRIKKVISILLEICEKIQKKDVQVEETTQKNNSANCKNKIM